MSQHPVVHIEIPSRDPKANAKFYADAFGWKIDSAPEFDYWMFAPGTGPGGGFPGLDQKMDIRADEIVIYVGSDDIEADLAKIESLGGKTLMPKQEIPGMGWFAFFADPTGNKVGLYKGMPISGNAS